ncbi:MAG TPA: hypothetical protein DDW65_15570, partial [Firmicutes bacterium]|nr:hypothetical protein [Bacillota bacterium]
MSTKLEDQLTPECTGCSCCAGRESEHAVSENSDRLKFISIGTGTVIFLIAVIFKFSAAIELTLFLLSYLLIGGEVLLSAIRHIAKGRIFDENFLM